MRFRWFLLAYPLYLAAKTDAQDNVRLPTWADLTAKGIAPYHQLTVDDFPINNTANPGFNFYLKPVIHPGYHFIMKPYHGFAYAALSDWTVFSGLDKNATSRKSSFKEIKTALPYAQAILDLNEIHARQIAGLKAGELPEVRGTSFEDAQTQLKLKVKDLLTAKYKKCDDEVTAFMKATNYGANTKKLQQLAGEIKKRLAATPNLTVPFNPTEGTEPMPTAGPSSLGSATPVVTATPALPP